MNRTGGGAGRVILVSNRGPLQYGREGGRRTVTRGAGGLVTALSALTRSLDDAVWLCAALSDEDVVVAGEHDRGLTPPEFGGRLRVRMVPLDPVAQEQFYSVIANPLLWFIQHSLFDLTIAPSLTRRESEAFSRGYTGVNAHFARIAAEEVEDAGGDAIVMVHDYHFYLFPQQLRARCPDVFIHHFVHIPWPQSDSWRVLPPPMREALFRGLLANDVIAFHTERYARNFLLGCLDVLGAEIDLDACEVRTDDRVVQARWSPISIDPAEFEARAGSPEVLDHERQLMESRREHLILRVDRTDPSKNIVRGFEAFDLLLQDHPELAGRVTLLALLQPSRQDVVEYVDYIERIRRVVADVNLQHGTTDWQPIDLRLEDNLDQAIAAYKQFDVLMVNGIFDGMNLVAKEAVLVNERNGVLALSENTGAHEELGPFAITLYPFDLQQQADALFAALTMSLQERADRRRGCVQTIREHDVTRWLEQQLADVGRVDKR